MGLGASGWRLDVVDEIPDGALDTSAAQSAANNPKAPSSARYGNMFQ
jgi:hypothetical protein